MDPAYYEPSFIKDSVWNQLNKIIDSHTMAKGEKKFNLTTTIVTDDNVVFSVTENEAKCIKEIIVSVKTIDRQKFLQNLQLAEGFKNTLLSIKDNLTKL